MLTLKHIGAAALASLFVIAITMDTADARRGGGGGGGVRAGGGGGGAMRAGGVRGGSFAGAGSRRAQVANPIARPGIGNRPGGPGNRPGWDNGNRPGGGWNNAGWYRPGLGWGAAAVGAGLAYGAYNDGYYGGDYYGDQSYQSYGAAQPYEATSDAVAACAQRFRSYDPSSQTYLAYNGRRVSCP